MRASGSAYWRAMMSTEPPGGNGTTSVMGLAGQRPGQHGGRRGRERHGAQAQAEEVATGRDQLLHGRLGRARKLGEGRIQPFNAGRGWSVPRLRARHEGRQLAVLAFGMCVAAHRAGAAQRGRADRGGQAAVGRAAGESPSTRKPSRSALPGYSASSASGVRAIGMVRRSSVMRPRVRGMDSSSTMARMRSTGPPRRSRR